MHATYILDVLCFACIASGQFNLGEQSARDSLQLRQRLVQPSPKAIFLRRNMMRSYERLGRCLSGMDRPLEALEAFQQGIAIGDEINILCGERTTCLNLAIDASLPDPTQDALTMAVIQKRLKLIKDDFEAKKENAIVSNYFIGILMELVEFHSIRGDQDNASQAMQTAIDLVAAAKTFENLELVEQSITAHLPLRDPSTRDGFDAANTLVTITNSNCILRRLQRIFEERGDHSRLATTSIQLGESNETFLEVFTAAKGLARAMDLAGDGELRIKYMNDLNQLLIRLRKYGKHAETRIGSAFPASMFSPP